MSLCDLHKEQIFLWQEFDSCDLWLEKAIVDLAVQPKGSENRIENGKPSASFGL